MTVPEEAQDQALRTLPGLEKVEILRFGMDFFPLKNISYSCINRIWCRI